MRIRGSGTDSAALRQAVARQLNAMDFTPSGMAPSAVLLVRRLTDPLPGRIAPDAGRVLPDARWRDAMLSQVDEKYRLAVRPASYHRLRGDEEAVVFRDTAEMLACLCRDICRKRAGHYWWWKRVVPGIEFTSSVSSVLLETLKDQAAFIPAVVGWLDDWAGIVELAGSLNEADARSLCRKVLCEHRFSELDRKLFMQNRTVAFDRLDARESAEPVVQSGDSSNGPSKPVLFQEPAAEEVGRDHYRPRSNSQRGTAAMAQFGPGSPPWFGIFDEDVQLRSSPVGVVLFLGLARLIDRKPAILRDEVFQRSIQSWWEAAGRNAIEEDSESFSGGSGQSFVDAATQGERIRNKESVTRSVDNELNGDRATATHEHDREIADTEQGGVEAGRRQSLKDRQHQWAEAGRNRGTYSSEGPLQSGIKNEGKTSPVDDEDRKQGDRLGKGTTDRPPVDGDSPESEAASAQHAEGVGYEAGPEPDVGADRPLFYSDEYIDTGLGGVLFLINVFERLDLPQCFEPEWKFDQQLDRWALVELIAKALLGRHYKKVSSDPIWSLVRKLGGREADEPLGKGFRGGRSFMIPADWLELNPVTPGELYWATGRRRTRLWCRDYVLAEFAPERNQSLHDCLDQIGFHYGLNRNDIKSSSAKYGQAPRRPLHDSTVVERKSDLAHWVALVTPFIQSCLRRALHLDSAGGRVLLTHFFELPARVYFTRSHVDVVTDLANSNLNIRRCGFDRNPGWCPDFGRVVLFHYW